MLVRDMRAEPRFVVDGPPHELQIFRIELAGGRLAVAMADGGVTTPSGRFLQLSDFSGDPCPPVFRSGAEAEAYKTDLEAELVVETLAQEKSH